VITRTMGNSLAISKLDCFSERRPASTPDSPLEDMSSKEIRQFRERGQAVLQAMITENRDNIDWAAVIRTSNKLHEQEQRWLKEKPRKDRRKSQKQALERRKKVDAAGSFTVNMLTHRGYDEEKVKKRSKLRQQQGSHGSSTFYSALEDNMSEASSGSAGHRSCDTDTMDVSGGKSNITETNLSQPCREDYCTRYIRSTN
jgi:hypothetical protein